MGETIAILFIFFMLLIVGAVFYLNIKRVTVGRDVQEQFELRAVEISQIISFMPEVQCTEANVVENGCFDIFKIQALDQIQKGLSDGVMNDAALFYGRDFGTSKIEISQIYPPGQSYTIYSNEPESFKDAPITHMPISLFDPVEDKYYFGVLDVTVYR